MIYQTYFKIGQKVKLRAKRLAPPEGRNELLSAILQSGEADYFDLFLPYGTEAVQQYSFSPDMSFELSSDALGLGIKVTVTFIKTLSNTQIRVQVQPDLQMFQRRAQPRLDCTIGLRFTHGQQALKELRKTWEKNATILSCSKNLPPIEGFTPCQLNLSPGGIRFILQPPAKPTEVCLLLLDLGDTKAPICALSEIIWTAETNEDGQLRAGMQFIAILEQDQKRIATFIRDRS